MFCSDDLYMSLDALYTHTHTHPGYICVYTYKYIPFLYFLIEHNDMRNLGQICVRVHAVLQIVVET